MLTNLLPGFRHTRVPLIAGTLWLLITWVVLGDRLLPDAGGGRVETLLYDLGSLVGRPTMMAGLAVLATLVGGMAPRPPVRLIARRLPINERGRWWQSALCWLFGTEPELAEGQGDFSHWLHRRASLAPKELAWSQFTGERCPAVLQVAARDLRENGSARVGGQRLANSDFVGDDDPSPHDWLTWGLAEASIRTELDRELPLQLQIERESLFNEYDRLRSESELRAAVVIPFMLLILMLTTESLLWAFALAIPIWLLRQAVRSCLEAEQLLLSAVRHGAVRSSTVAFVDSLQRNARRSLRE